MDSITPDKGIFLISANNTNYKVEFNAVAKSQSNASLEFATGTILTDECREFASMGNDKIFKSLMQNHV